MSENVSLCITESALRFEIIDILYNKGDTIEFSSWDEIKELCDYLSENSDYTAHARKPNSNSMTNLESRPSSYNIA